ncbi:MAG TPA: tetratricopeptide repeat protein, partial [Burkholderiales bacterium]|nr:tetratricopeptide repeat protein [Burkholderiales bacterium]
AFTGEPDNADFAYNLAVSLDHLRQPKLALEYYQRAIALAKARGARFDIAAAESRVAQLAH